MFTFLDDSADFKHISLLVLCISFFLMRTHCLMVWSGRLHFYLVFSFPFLLSISHNMPKSLMNFDWIILLGIGGCQPKSVSMVGVCYQWNWFCCSKVLSRFSKLFSKYSHLFYQNSTYDKVVCSFITDWICIFITWVLMALLLLSIIPKSAESKSEGGLWLRCK